MQVKLWPTFGWRGGDYRLSPVTRLFSCPDRTEPRHLLAVDLARGIGAIAILFWHYQHFFYHGTTHASPLAIEQQPLLGVFGLLYRHGDTAVQFFWLLSGFVFAATYCGRNVSAGAFVRARVSRLYPLHLLTLIVVAALQVISFRLLGHAQIYANNDAYHFILQLFFASSWGLERGASFNGPIWSVSVEILVYAIFWLCLRRIFARGIALPLGVAAMAIIARTVAPPGDLKLISDCLAHFFIGVAAYVAYRTVKDTPRALLWVGGLLALVGAMAVQAPGPPATAGMVLLLTGMLILVSALEAFTLRHKTVRHLERLRWIGDSSYGTYLWHVPIQIVTLIVLDRLRIDHDIAKNPLFLTGFLASTMTVARLSYLFFERPIRDRLRAPA
jgi:peptidoglycan/LPS O-acetylase OafA/YrhL